MGEVEEPEGRKGADPVLAVLVWLVGGTLRPARKRLTDATWFTDGTQWVNKPYFAGRVPSRRHLRAGWKRMLRRWAGLAMIAGAVYGVLVWPAQTAWAVTLVASVVVGLSVELAVRRARSARHYRERVKPLHQALAPVVGLDPLTVEPRSWLHVPRGYRSPAAVIRVDLPVTVVAGAEDDEDDYRPQRSPLRTNVTAVVVEKLGLTRSETRVSFTTVGSKPHVTFRHLPPVPARVLAREHMGAIEAAKESAPLLGFGRNLKPVTVDLDDESPHMMLSCGTGAGKSKFAQGFAAQVLHNGGRVLVLDVKRTSQRWLKDHPHVRYARDPEDIINELLALDEELTRRQHLGDDDENAYVGPRFLVICEERNAMSLKLESFWAANKPKEAKGPCPAITVINNVSFMGREALVHLMSVGQYGTAASAGGSAERSNYGCIVFGRAPQRAWRMLAPEVSRPPRKSTHRGRMHVLVDGAPVEFQAVLWTTEEAREWAWGCFPDGLEHEASRLGRDAFYRGAGGGTVPVSGGTVPAGDLVAGEVLPEAVDGPETADEPAAGPGDGQADPEPVGSADDLVWAGLVEAYNGPAAGEPATSPSAGQGGSRETCETSETRDVANCANDAEGAKSAIAAEGQQWPEAMSLREAVEAGVVSPGATVAKSVDILRSARKRDPEFPAPVQQRGNTLLFSPADLQRWERNRERTSA